MRTELGRKLTLGRPWHTGKQNIKLDPTELMWEGVGLCWIHLVKESTVL
jgi:hypothetical protein